MKCPFSPTNLYDVAYNDTVNSFRRHFASRQGSPGSRLSQVSSCEVFQKTSISSKGCPLSSNDEHTYCKEERLMSNYRSVSVPNML